MKEWKIIVTPEAQKDIYDIHSYIADILLEPTVAEHQINRILDAMRSLNSMPKRNPLYEKEPWHSRGLRKMVIDNYLIFYLPNEKIHEVAVFHIFYAGRNTEEWLELNS